jgi:hypothetical protein
MSLVVPHSVFARALQSVPFYRWAQCGHKDDVSRDWGDENLHLLRGVANWFEVFAVGKKVEEEPIRNGAGCLFSVSCVIF